MTFIAVVENALAETEPIGVKPHVEQRPKYTLDQLLADDFRLERPLAPKERSKRVGAAVKAMFGSAPSRKRKGKELPPVSPLMQKWLDRKRPS